MTPGSSGSNNENPNPAASEAYLDVEWAGAVAPGATVYLVIAADTDLEAGLYLAAEHAVYSNIAPVISVSFGLCEQYLGSDQLFPGQPLGAGCCPGDYRHGQRGRLWIGWMRLRQLSDC